MSFLNRDSRAARTRQIRRFLRVGSSPGIAVLLAAADLEWTLLRVISGVGRVTIKSLDQKRITSLDGYEVQWGRLMKHTKSYEPLRKVVADWAVLQDHFKLRNKLIHGVQGSAGVKYAAPCVGTMLDASEKLYKYGTNRGIDIFERHRKRKKS